MKALFLKHYLQREKRIAINNFKSIYADTSVLIPFNFNEKESEKTQQVFSEGQCLLISEINRIEFISAFKKKVRLGHTTKNTIQEIFNLFDHHVKKNFYQQIFIQKEHYKAARRIITTTENPLRSLDAIHLSTASLEKCVLFSFDQTLNKTAEEFSIKTVTI